MKTLVGVLALAAAVQGAAFAQTPAASPQASNATMGGGAVTLVPAGKKGPAGSAVLSQQGTNLTVTLHLPPGYQSTGKAAISAGSCSSTGTAATAAGKSYQLKVGGSSDMTTGTVTTISNVTIDSLTSSPHIITVQGTPTLCGDITNLLPPQKP